MLLILFDEWDYRLTFEARLQGLDLPEWDKFRREAIDCKRAYPPGSGTMNSVPGITVGRRLEEVKVTSPSTLSFRRSVETDFESWSQSDSVFRVAARAGYSTAIVGWFMPYCRIFGAVCDSCEWWPASFMGFPQSSSVIDSTALQLRSLIETRGLSPFGQTIELRPYLESYQGVLNSAVRAASDPKYDFVYLHLPMTHWPFFYNRVTGRFDRRWNDRKAYWDGLALGERAFATISNAMRRAGVWDMTTVMLTSDHSYRDSDLVDMRKDARVPLLIRCGGSARKSELADPINTQVLPSLIMAALGGTFQGPEELQGWLREHSRRASRF